MNQIEKEGPVSVKSDALLNLNELQSQSMKRTRTKNFRTQKNQRKELDQIAEMKNKCVELKSNAKRLESGKNEMMN